jgi:hypothetical protein
MDCANNPGESGYLRLLLLLAGTGPAVRYLVVLVEKSSFDQDPGERATRRPGLSEYSK